MSIASLGIVGSLAGTALPQRAAEADRADRESSVAERAAEATEKAENAAGIGQTEEDSQISERDADGRRLWEEQGGTNKRSDPSSDEATIKLVKDPTGTRGVELDLVG